MHPLHFLLISVVQKPLCLTLRSNTSQNPFDILLLYPFKIHAMADYTILTGRNTVVSKKMENCKYVKERYFQLGYCEGCTVGKKYLSIDLLFISECMLNTI